VPAVIHPESFTQAMDLAVAAHAALGCRGASRADFRYDDTEGEPGRLVLLEVNTQPGSHRLRCCRTGAFCGITFPALCAWMVEEAQ